MAKFPSRLSGMFGSNQKNNTSTPGTPPTPPPIKTTSTSLPEFQVSAGTLTKYNGTAVEVNIPENLGITKIGQKAFFKCNTVKRVKLPKGLINIANHAFANCENLERIFIPDTVTSMGNNVFENCKNLISITFPPELSAVGNYLFSSCTSLESVDLPEALRTISNYMFYKCSSLKSITITEKVAGIGWRAFSGCTSLSNVTFCNRLNTIGNYAFENCTSLETISIPANLQNFGEGVFLLCENLKNIEMESSNSALTLEDGVLYNKEKTMLYTYPAKLDIRDSFDIPDTVTTICYGSFSNNTNLKSINIPNSVETIENYAFFNSNNLTEIIIPESVTQIGKNVFQKCENLTSVVLPQAILKIDSGMFSGCSNLKYIQYSDKLTSIGEISFYGCISLETIEFPASLTSIGRAAFSYCNSLKAINISSFVDNIDKGAFTHCNNLTTINVDPANPKYISIDNILYDKDEKHIYVYPGGKSNTSYKINNNTTRIYDQAFSGCSYIEEIIIPFSVHFIGISAFSDCQNLKKVYIEKGVTNISTFCFSKCPSLERVTIPDSVTNIDSSAFTDCNNLTIICKAGSYASQYAIDNNIQWADLRGKEKTDDTIKISSESAAVNNVNNANASSNAASQTADSTNTDTNNNTANTIAANNKNNTNKDSNSNNFNNSNNTKTNNSNTGTIVKNANNNTNNGVINTTNDHSTEITEKTNNNRRSRLHSLNKISKIHRNIDKQSENINNNPVINKETSTPATTNSNTQSSTTAKGPIIANKPSSPNKMPELNLPKSDTPVARPTLKNNRQNSDNKYTNQAPASFNQFINSKDANQQIKNNFLRNKNRNQNFDDTPIQKNMVEFIDRSDEINETQAPAFASQSEPDYTNNKPATTLNEKLYNKRLQSYNSDTSNVKRITNLTSTPNTESSVILTWDAVPVAVEYCLLKYNSSIKEYENISKLKTNKAMISGILPDIEDEYKIMAYSLENNEKVPCACSNAIKVSLVLPPLNGLKSTEVTSKSVTFEWEPIKDALKYIVYTYNPAQHKFEEYDQTSKNVYTIYGLNGGTTIKIKVAATKMISKTECTTSLSKELVVTTDMASVRGAIMASHTSTTIKLNWISMNDVYAYKVYLYNPDSDYYEFLAQTKENFITLTELTPNTEYVYRIRAVKIVDGEEILGPPSPMIKAYTN